jgi:hypothetical protein
MISIRDGHAVIPVAAANKRKIAGFIHDESATGRTFYVEPVEVVELNNELRELEYSEKREVVRILTELTATLRTQVDGLMRIEEYLTRIDSLRAKARWAISNDAVRPIISTEGRLLLRKARHPLLQQTLRSQSKEIVPLDMELDSVRRILIDDNVNTWMAPHNIPAGSKYAHVINDAIENCSCVLLLLSEYSQSSEWVEKEVERAVAYKKTIVALHIDESQLNSGFRFYLGNEQIVPVNSIDKNDSNIQKAIKAVKTFLT